MSKKKLDLPLFLHHIRLSTGNTSNVMHYYALVWSQFPHLSPLGYVELFMRNVLGSLKHIANSMSALTIYHVAGGHKSVDHLNIYVV